MALHSTSKKLVLQHVLLLLLWCRSSGNRMLDEVSLNFLSGESEDVVSTGCRPATPQQDDETAVSKDTLVSDEWVDDPQQVLRARFSDARQYPLLKFATMVRLPAAESFEIKRTVSGGSRAHAEEPRGAPALRNAERPDVAYWAFRVERGTASLGFSVDFVSARTQEKTSIVSQKCYSKNTLVQGSWDPTEDGVLLFTFTNFYTKGITYRATKNQVAAWILTLKKGIQVQTVPRVMDVPARALPVPVLRRPSFTGTWRLKSYAPQSNPNEQQRREAAASVDKFVDHYLCSDDKWDLRGLKMVNYGLGGMLGAGKRYVCITQTNNLLNICSPENYVAGQGVPTTRYSMNISESESDATWQPMVDPKGKPMQVKPYWKDSVLVCPQMWEHKCGADAKPPPPTGTRYMDGPHMVETGKAMLPNGETDASIPQVTFFWEKLDDKDAATKKCEVCSPK